MSDSYNLLSIDNLPTFLFEAGMYHLASGLLGGGIGMAAWTYLLLAVWETTQIWLNCKLLKIVQALLWILAARFSEKHMWDGRGWDFRGWKLQFLLLQLLFLEAQTLLAGWATSFLQSSGKGTQKKIIRNNSNKNQLWGERLGGGKRYGEQDPPAATKREARESVGTWKGAFRCCQEFSGAVAGGCLFNLCSAPLCRRKSFPGVLYLHACHFPLIKKYNPLISADSDNRVEFPCMQMNCRMERRNPVHLREEGCELIVTLLLKP